MAQDTLRVEHFQRESGGHWPYTAENHVDAGVKIGCELTLAEVYHKVESLREPLAYYR